MKCFFSFLIVFVFTTHLTAQTHTIEIHSNNRVASLLLEPSEYATWIATNGFANNNQRAPLIQEIYQNFDDDFDFIFFILNEAFAPSNLPSGQFVNFSNQVAGIGQGIFDNSGGVGSSGRLKGVLQLPARDFIRRGPALHEIMHNWGNNAIDAEVITELGTDVTSSPLPAHWGFTGGSNRGQLGGFDQNELVANDDGSYSMGSFGFNANGANGVPYTDFELYLMGMIGIEEVANFDVFTNITSASFDNEDEIFTIIGDKQTYTPEFIESTLGERVPSSLESQKDFKSLIVVLTDEPLISPEWIRVDIDAENFGRIGPDNFPNSFNFWEATRELGTMEFGNLDQSSSIEPLSTNDFEFQELIQVFPIPAQDSVNIKINQNEEVSTILLYNTLGQLVREFEQENTSNDFTIDVSSYRSGVYFLHFKNDFQLLGTKQLIISN